MRQVPLSSNKHWLAAPFQIRQNESVYLRPGGVNGMLYPFLSASSGRLLKPVQTIIVADSEDDVVQAIAIHVHDRHPDTRPARIAVVVPMPGPLIVLCVYLLVPAMRSDNVDLPIAVHITPPYAMVRALGPHRVLYP